MKEEERFGRRAFELESMDQINLYMEKLFRKKIETTLHKLIGWAKTFEAYEQMISDTKAVKRVLYVIV